MWFLIAPACIALLFCILAFARHRRLRRREHSMVLAEVRDFARRAEDPAVFRELRFTAPLHFDEDRTHDTMFTVRHGSYALAFILDTSRARIRWWVLAESFASDGSRSTRSETTFVESAIPMQEIQILLKAARGEFIAAPVTPPTETTVEVSTVVAPEPSIDPFDTPDTTAPA